MEILHILLIPFGVPEIDTSKQEYYTREIAGYKMTWSIFLTLTEPTDTTIGSKPFLIIVNLRNNLLCKPHVPYSIKTKRLNASPNGIGDNNAFASYGMCLLLNQLHGNLTLHDYLIRNRHPYTYFEILVLVVPSAPNRRIPRLQLVAALAVPSLSGYLSPK